MRIEFTPLFIIFAKKQAGRAPTNRSKKNNNVTSSSNPNKKSKKGVKMTCSYCCQEVHNCRGCKDRLQDAGSSNTYQVHLFMIMYFIFTCCIFKIYYVICVYITSSVTKKHQHICHPINCSKCRR